MPELGPSGSVRVRHREMPSTRQMLQWVNYVCKKKKHLPVREGIL